MLLQAWFETCLQNDLAGNDPPAIQYHPVSGDASFRRYIRASLKAGTQASAQNSSFILMDAPPDRENCRPFVAVADKLAAAGVQVPQIFHADLQQGFLCLSDFGDTLLLAKLHDSKTDNSALPAASELYSLAFDELLKIQRCEAGAGHPLPAYDEKLLMTEMQLFRDWFCKALLGLELKAADHAVLDSVFGQLTQSALAQTRVCVHRDYHSRNLLYREQPDGTGLLGVLDFQDAVHGPFTYDLVSLLKDCYIDWPAVQVQQWALQYLGLAQAAGLVPDLDAERFLEDFGRMGVQRHLKAIGIFARLWLRDGKDGYLPDIPRTFAYVLATAAEDAALQPFADWLEQRIGAEVDGRIKTALQAASR